MRTQQEQVYAAERTVDWGHTFANLDSVQKFLDTMRDEPWWQELAPFVYRIEVAPGPKGTKKSQGSWHPEAGAGLIELHSTKIHVVLHEAAHCIAESNNPGAGHSPHWVRTFLLLTYHMRGAEAWTLLRQAFLDHGVVIDPAMEVV